MNTSIYISVTNFLKKRTLEFIGLCLISIGVLLSISFITYSPSDPSLIYGPEKTAIKNFFGIYGSIVSDFLLQSFGLVSFLLLITIISWGFNLLIKKELNNILLKLFFIVLYLIFGCVLIYITYNQSFWLIDNGNSGFVGQNLYEITYKYFPLVRNQYSILILIIFTTLFFCHLNKYFLLMGNLDQKLNLIM